MSERITAFDLAPGRIIGGKYLVESKLGGGWEGEVYKVTERRTGATRAAKVFYPHRNPRDRAVTRYARKLERLNRCSIVIQYHHSEELRFRGRTVTCLISEFVEGVLLRDFVRGRPERRLPTFEALCLLHALAAGIEEIHECGEYHGDLHDKNVLISRRGIRFDVKIVDFFHWGAPSARHRSDDVVDLVHLLYHAVGGPDAYPGQPVEIKAICKGLRRDLVKRNFPTARVLREHLESFGWTDDGA